MRLSRSILLVGVLALFVDPAVAAEADATAPAAAAKTPAAPKAPAAAQPPAAPDGATPPADTQRRVVEGLPAPLDKLACNIVDLEKSGHFLLTSVTLSRSEDFGDEALVWTVKVTKPISCRHAMILLRSFSDVRCYHFEKDAQKDLYSTDLLYSSRIAEGAVHGDVLQQDEEFQVWVQLTLRQAEMLVHQRADALVFYKPQILLVRPLSATSTRWNSAGTGIPRWFSKGQDPQRMPK